MSGTRNARGMEALLLISALAIVAIFVFAHLSRQTEARDKQALLLANQVQKAALELTKAVPQAKLSLEALKQKGLTIPKPLQVEIPLEQSDPQKWKVLVWHPSGGKRYEVTANGITPKPQ